MKKHTLSITNARKDIFDIAKDIDATKSIYTLTEHGKPVVVMLAADTFDAWEKTIDVSTRIPTLEADMNMAEEEIKTNQYISLAHLFREQGFLVKDAPTDTYVPHRPLSQSSKRRKKRSS